MIKKEKSFDRIINGPVIGERAIIEINGQQLKTSKVEKWHSSCTGDITIETRNTIYKHFEH